jgi:mutator protein MutT
MDVVAAVLVQKNKFLLARRPSDKSHKDCWEFPGGKVKTGESNEAALVRELYEELGVQFKESEPHFLGTLKNEKIQLHFYSLNLNQAYLPKEHPAISWNRLTDIREKFLCPLDREATKAYKEAFRALLR